MHISESPDAKRTYSIKEYLALEDKASGKSEYWNGQIRAMSGGSMEHAAIMMSCGAALKQALKGKGCTVFSSELKVHAAATNSYLYPDATVVCGEVELQDERRDILCNPTLIVEVLSPSTAAYDALEKFDAYQRIPSLREYVLVSQDQYRVEVRSKHEDWSEFHIYTDPQDLITFRSIPAAISLGEFYGQITFSK